MVYESVPSLSNNGGDNDNGNDATKTTTTHTSSHDAIEAETRQTLRRMQFYERRDKLAQQGDRLERRNSENKTVQDLTRALVQWIRSSNSKEHNKKSPG